MTPRILLSTLPSAWMCGESDTMSFEIVFIAIYIVQVFQLSFLLAAAFYYTHDRRLAFTYIIKERTM